MNDNKLPNPLQEERYLYPTWCKLAPVAPPYNKREYQYNKYKHLLPYADEAVNKNDQDKVNGIQTGRTISNHDHWEEIYLNEFTRVQNTCLWDQWWKKMLGD